MRLIVVLIVLLQLKEYEQHPTSYSRNYESRRQRSIPPGYYGNTPQNQYGSVQQLPPFNNYQGPQQSPVPLSQQDLTRPNVHYLPPSQAQRQVKLPENIDGYQLVSSGYPSGSDNNQGQPTTQQIPQNFQGISQLPSSNQAPFQNNYQIPPNYYENSPVTNIQPQSTPSDNNQPLFPYNFRQQNQYQIPPQNFYQLPQQQNFPTELTSIPSQNINPFGGVSPSGDLSSKVNNLPQNTLPYFPQNLPQPNLQNGPQAPQQYGPYQPYTVNPISPDILPYLNQLNNPQNGQNQLNVPQNSQYLSNQQNGPQNGQYLPNQLNIPQNGPYLPNQLNFPQNAQYFPNIFPAYGPQQTAKQFDNFQGGAITAQPGQGNFFNDAFFQLSKQQPQAGPQINKEGYQVVNELTYNQNGIYSQPQQTNAQINDEGFQVVNEAPITHYVSMGQPNTKIINLKQQIQTFNPPKNLSPNSYGYNDQVNNNGNILIQSKQPQTISNSAQKQQPEVSDLEPKTKETSQKKTQSPDAEGAKCSKDSQHNDSCACDLCNP
ncbi:GATA zinc finger domain-containing protein 14-like [Episyrphus balteatus]|uniref:GATA zinc finger domain-containing protein 14-like n=1 Tax=Episyrphus balteatus TaxID=286459 RepID=UPI00248613B9|nr:GATA zinc finger domain-containing protein 14-like [Episyrphus balteatus]